MLGGINFHNSSASILLEDVAVALDDMKFVKTKTKLPNNITLLGKVNQGGFNQLTELNFKHKFSPEELSNLSKYLDELFYEISSTLYRKQLLNIEYLLNIYAVSLPFEAKALREELKLNLFQQNGLDNVHSLMQKRIEIKNRLMFIDNFDAQLWLGCISKIRIQLENRAQPPFDARFFCPLMSDQTLSKLLGTLNAYQKLRSNYFTASIRPTGVSDRPLLILFFGALFGFFVPFFIISFRRR
jgi:hypothetical protein